MVNVPQIREQLVFALGMTKPATEATRSTKADLLGQYLMLRASIERIVQDIPGPSPNPRTPSDPVENHTHGARMK